MSAVRSDRRALARLVASGLPMGGARGATNQMAGLRQESVMSSTVNLARCGSIAVVLIGFTAASTFAAPPAQSTPDRAGSCFFVSQWSGWTSPSPDVLYLGVNVHEVYRVQLSTGSSELQLPDVHLVFEARGSNTVCSALDLDLSVSDGRGFREPLIATSITRLSPAEVAAIPPKFRPQ